TGPLARTGRCAAGQNSSSANRHRLPRLRLAPTARTRELGQLRDLAFQSRELRRDDQDVREHDHEDHEVGCGDVLLCRGHVASTSRSSRNRVSSRFPASSTWYSVVASASIAAHATQNEKNIHPDTWGPRDVNTVGWMKSFARRIARNDTG